MKKGTLIAAGLTAVTLVFLYTQRKPAASRTSPEERARRTADARARLLAGYDDLVRQAALVDLKSNDVPTLEATASDLRDYGFPEKAKVLDAIVSRARAATAAPRTPGPIERANELIFKADNDIASISIHEAHEMGSLAVIMRSTIGHGIGRPDIAERLEHFGRLWDAYVLGRTSPPLTPP